MKKFGVVAVILCLVLGIYFFAKKNSSREISATPANLTNTANTAGGTAGVSEAASTLPPGAGAGSPRPAAMAGSPAPAAGATAGLSPVTIIENMRSAIRNYGTTFGENPVGINPEITAALAGGNPKQINFLTPDSGLQVNGQGELVDGWGTPFFFHQLSGHEMEIHSAGPDRKMWTLDDLVTK